MNTVAWFQRMLALNTLGNKLKFTGISAAALVLAHNARLRIFGFFLSSLKQLGFDAVTNKGIQ